MAREPLSETEKKVMRDILERVEFAKVLERFLEQEAFNWKQRVVAEALSPSELDPVRRLCKQTEYAARAHEAENMLQLMRKKATE